MRITEEEARNAGELTLQRDSWTDEELALIIKVNKLVTAYLWGKGSKWQLALTPIGEELRVFEGFVRARKQDKGS